MFSKLSNKALFLVLIALLCLGSGGFLVYLNAAPAAHPPVLSEPTPTPESVIIGFSEVSGSPMPSPTPTPTPTVQPTPNPTPNPTPTPTPKPTPSPTPKPTPTPTPTPKPTPTPAPKNGTLITLTFDDALKSHYKNAYPLLRDAGVKGTWYILTGALNGQFGASYMKSGNVIELANNGQEIGAHTRTHPHLPTLSEDQVRDEIQGSLQDLQNLGISVSTFAYPFGEYNSTVLTTVKSLGFTGARSTREGFVNPGNDLFTLKSPSLTVNTSPDQVQQWIDQAMQNGNWLILTFHDINTGGDQYSVTPENFRIMFDKVLDAQHNGARIVTVKEGIGIMRGR